MIKGLELQKQLKEFKATLTGRDIVVIADYNTIKINDTAVIDANTSLGEGFTITDMNLSTAITLGSITSIVKNVNKNGELKFNIKTRHGNYIIIRKKLTRLKKLKLRLLTLRYMYVYGKNTLAWVLKNKLALNNRGI